MLEPAEGCRYSPAVAGPGSADDSRDGAAKESRHAGRGVALLDAGRRAYTAGAWQEAYASLSAADTASPLAAADVELLATAAAMLGRDDEWMTLLERAHQRYLEGGETAGAIRCAFWSSVRLMRGGEIGRATAWLARAERLLERVDADCVERGYLLLPQMFRHEAEGDLETAAATARDAAEIGEHFDDNDLVALATHERGHVLIRLGRVKEGLGLLDDAMLAATAGALSPYVTGIVYCGTIAACQEVYELRRASEWTAALSAWCADQPGLLAFTGNCLVHRAEVMQLHGAWSDALEEARRAGDRLAQAENERAAGEACYRKGEVHRLQGEFTAAEEAYKEASRRGFEPHPGLALLRLAQRRGDAAVAAIRRVLAERTEPLKRARLLPAYVEIALAAGEPDEARIACAELEEIAAGFETRMLDGMAAHARGAVDLAAGEPRTALVALRRAAEVWQDLGAPYEAACARVLTALACRALGDDDGASFELEAAREVFERLGAAPDVVWAESLARPAAADDHGLTHRELEVLRMVATGKSNREIASELVISEHTVARHVQNIFQKLSVSSRTAAGAFAFEHDLV
jgi:DNA-binding CsgD family transcriptional regulator